MPKKYPQVDKPELQPKENSQLLDSKVRLVGKLALYKQLKEQIASLEEELSEQRLSLIDLMKQVLTPDHDGSYRLEDTNAGLNVTLGIQKRENFNKVAAMDLLNTLPEETARNYIIETTDKNQLASAFMQEAITEEQLKTVFTNKTVEVLTVKDL